MNHAQHMVEQEGKEGEKKKKKGTGKGILIHPELN